jgi:hypothetical protein
MKRRQSSTSNNAWSARLGAWRYFNFNLLIDSLNLDAIPEGGLRESYFEDGEKLNSSPLKPRVRLDCNANVQISRTP